MTGADFGASGEIASDMAALFRSSWPDLFRPSTSSSRYLLKAWMPGTSPGMTERTIRPGNDVSVIASGGEAIQRFMQGALDCFVASAPRNDGDLRIFDFQNWLWRRQVCIKSPCATSRFITTIAKENDSL
jgi:hypothetical protein